MKRFVTLRISIGALLAILLALVLVVVGAEMYRNHIFHNWFFRTLSADHIESVTISAENSQTTATLSSEEAEALVALMKGIRLSEQPYKNVQVVGNYGGYEIVFKSGIRFCMKVSIVEDVGMIVIDENFYPVADLREEEALEAKNFRMLEDLYSQQAANHFS